MKATSHHPCSRTGQRSPKPWTQYSYQASQLIRSLFAQGVWFENGVYQPGTSQSPGLVLGAAVGTVSLLMVWNWKLAVSLAMGASVMILVQLVQQSQGSLLGLVMRRGCRSTDGSIMNQSGIGQSVVSGLITLFLTYLITSIAVELHNPWLALGVGLQLMMTLVILLLSWGWLPSPLPSYSLYHSDLTTSDPFKRLSAIHQLQTLLQQNGANAEVDKWVTDYLKLALNRESEPVVKAAIIEALQIRRPNSGTQRSTQDTVLS